MKRLRYNPPEKIQKQKHKKGKEIVIEGETYHQILCVYDKNLFGCEPTEEDRYVDDVSSRVVYKSKAGTVIIIRSIFGYENDRERSLGNIAWILEDYIVIEDLVNKAKNKDSAVILISGTLDDPMFTSYIIENENLKKVLEKNDPEDYGYFICKFYKNMLKGRMTRFTEI